MISAGKLMDDVCSQLPGIAVKPLHEGRHLQANVAYRMYVPFCQHVADTTTVAKQFRGNREQVGRTTCTARLPALGRHVYVVCQPAVPGNGNRTVIM